MERKIEINNLRISFRTNNGAVKAVRGIDLKLYKGETLAIVGESGSGKSVTARALMGILAPNAIVESGEIIYDGKDLLKITEEEFHDYRGNRLSMIFQDPMSSLNPIMRIGKQLTEAMLLNGRLNQKSAKKDFETKMNQLQDAVKEAAKNSKNGIQQADAATLFASFRKYTAEVVQLEHAYETAYSHAKEAYDSIKSAKKELAILEKEDAKEFIRELNAALKQVYNPYVIAQGDAEFETKVKAYYIAASGFTKPEDADKVLPAMLEVQAVLKKALDSERPDFFQMNENLNDEFMGKFMEVVRAGIAYAEQKAAKAKIDLIPDLDKAIAFFKQEMLEEKECRKVASELIKKEKEAIDYLAVKKDSRSYTFETSLNSAVDTYFKGIPNNKKEEQRVAKDTAKYEKAVAKGKDVGQVVPALLVDLELAHSNMIRVVEDFKRTCERAKRQNSDYDVLAQEMLAYLKTLQKKQVYKVTKGMAKNHAIELMEEVGIPQARKRYKQYPFQFSGGMRQRIVIAIALAANPDILICDEPTTALDVTIQSQILELINRLKKERNLSVIFITHDLGVVANMADRIAVMYAGKVVEYGTADDIFYEPAHPYTWALLSSMPDLDTKEKLEAIPGTPPNMIHPPKGDAFAARNKYALEIDFEQQPPMFEISNTHHAATWLLHPNAPKVWPPKIVTDRIARMKKLEDK